MSLCKSCGAELCENVSFCTVCGQPIPIAADEFETVAVAEKPKSACEESICEESFKEHEEERYTPPTPAVPPAPAPVYQKTKPELHYDEPAPKSPYAGITTTGFIGILLLFMIPIVGAVFVIVWACGGCRKEVKRNLSRAILVVTIIAIILIILAGIVLGFMFGPKLAGISISFPQ